MQAASSTPTTICGTVVIQEKGSDRSANLVGRISTATYEACRTGRLQLDSFPDVNPLLQEMQRTSGNQNSPSQSFTYKVTSLQADGSLVVKEQFFEQFGEMPEFDEIIQHHNQTYNTEGLRLKETVVNPQKPTVSKAVVVATDEPLTTAKMTALPNTLQP